MRTNVIELINPGFECCSSCRTLKPQSIGQTSPCGDQLGVGIAGVLAPELDAENAESTSSRAPPLSTEMVVLWPVELCDAWFSMSISGICTDGHALSSLRNTQKHHAEIQTSLEIKLWWGSRVYLPCVGYRQC